MQALFRQGFDSTPSVSSTRQRMAMDCITNTHENLHLHRKDQQFPRKRRFSKGKRNGPIKERHPIQTQISLSLLSPRLDSSKYSHSNTGMSFTENDRASTARRVSAGFPPDSGNNVMGIQARRRRGTSKSKQVAPLQISVPPVAALYEVEGRFENPRKAPQPQGVAFNARQPGTGTPPATSPRMPSSNATTPSTAREVKDISQASVFSLPKYDPDKELRKLQKLWSRRGSILLSPLLCPSPSPRQQSTENNESDESRDGTTLRVVQDDLGTLSSFMVRKVISE